MERTTHHTPGPWHTDVPPHGSTARDDWTGNPRLWIANEEGRIVATTGCQPEEDANARLIAAAPELAEALALRVALEDNDVHEADTRWKQVRKMERSALRKAGLL